MSEQGANPEGIQTSALSRQFAGLVASLRQQVFQMGVLLGLLVLCVFFSLASPYFLSLENLMNVARQISMIGIIAVGMTFIIITGGIDLSVGAIVGLSGCITAGLLRDGTPIPLAIMTGLAFGLAAGLVNGSLIAIAGLPPFIATLASLSVWRGLALTYTQGYAIFPLPPEFAFLGRGYLGPLPLPVILMALVYALGYYLLNHTAFGRYVYSVGGNLQAAKLSGVRVKHTLITVYGLSGLLRGPERNHPQLAAPIGPRPGRYWLRTGRHRRYRPGWGQPDGWPRQRDRDLDWRLHHRHPGQRHDAA